MRRVLVVAATTFRELVRSRLLVVWTLGVAGLCSLSFLLSFLSYGDILRIFTDLGLAGMEGAGLMVLLLALAVTYNTEMEQKAVFLQLTKPLTRGEYLLGRCLGFFAVNVLVLAGMAAVIAGVVLVLGGQTPPGFLAAVILLILAQWVLTVVGLAYQMVATSMVGCVLYAFFTALLGHLVSHLRWLLEQQPAPLVKFLLNVAYLLLPNMEVYNLKDRLYQPGPLLDLPLTGDVLLYTFAYSFFAFLAGWLALEKREFK
jgi:ABC-type transport system involved in multi-copper enzyme maturation permease subunit